MALANGAKDAYRRLSGQKKGNYSKLKTNDYDEDFSTTLSKAKATGQKQGTYAIIPEEEKEVEKEFKKMGKIKATLKKQSGEKLDFYKEVQNVEDEIKKQSTPKKQETPTKIIIPMKEEWTTMKKLQERNERNIRASIERTNEEERKKQISSDIDAQIRFLMEGNLQPPPAIQPPPKPPRTPKRQLAINNFSKLVGKKQDQLKEANYESILQEAEPLITKRMLIKKKSELETQATKLEKQKAKLEPVMKKLGATKIQEVMRGHMGRKQFKMNQLENEIQRTVNMLDSVRRNINEQRPEGLRRRKNQLQDKRSEINTRRQDLPFDEKQQQIQI